MQIVIDNFSGIAPVLDPRRLNDDMAQVAHNCYFDARTLKALKNPAPIPDVTVGANTVTMYPYQNTVLTFTALRHIVPSPVHNDTFERLFYTGGAYPVVRSGASEYRLGIPRPSAAPTVSATAVPDSEDVDSLIEAESVSYVFTYVDGFGAEGPNSAPSTVIERVRNTNVNLSFPAVPSGAYNFGSAARIRVYRSNTGTQATEYQFVAELAIATATWVDDVPNEQLQELLPSAEWIGPPDDNTTLWPQGALQGLAAGRDGVLAGFTKRTVHFCEPYIPHAWPLRYRITSRFDIVAITAISGGWLVVTTGRPFLITGSDPASYTEQPIEGEGSLPCVAARSLVNMGDYAIYASTAGLVAVSGNRAQLVTRSLLSEREWSTFNPSSFVAGAHMTYYVAFYTAGAVSQALLFNPLAEKNALSTASIHSDALYFVAGDSRLYLKQGTTVCSWDSGSAMTYTWKSKDFVLPARTCFTYLEVIKDTGSCAVTVTADGVNVVAASVTGQYSVLPGYFPAQVTSLTVSGTAALLLVGLHEILTPGG